MEIGRKIWNRDKAIWVLQGRHRDQEKFAGYVYNNNGSSTVPTFKNGVWAYTSESRRINDALFEAWKTKYYTLEGWDPANGWPKKATLENLGLHDVAVKLAAAGKLGSPW